MWLLAASASAQSIEATVSLSLTEGLARPQAYVPVQLKVTNASGATVEALQVSCGGAVDTVVSWRLAPGESAEKVVPVYFAGGDLHLTITPRTSAGSALAPVVAVPPAVRTAPPGTGLLGVLRGDGEPDAPYLRTLATDMGFTRMQVLRLSGPALAAAIQCNLLDAVLGGGDTPSATGRARLVVPAGEAWYVLPQDDRTLKLAAGSAARFPVDIQGAAQPEIYGLFAAKVWPAADRLQLWTWLALFALAATVLAFVAPRRRPWVATAALVGLAAGACVAIEFGGEVRRASLAEARVFYVSGGAAALEEITLLQTRGGAVARLEESRPPAPPPPTPCRCPCRPWPRPNNSSRCRACSTTMAPPRSRRRAR
jgi:hypothetical protein